MGSYLDWFFVFLTTMIDGIWKVISGIANGLFQIFNIAAYIKQFGVYKSEFKALDWILAVFSFILVMAIWVIIVYMLVLLIRKYIRFRKSAVGNEDLLEEVADLHRDVMRLTKEKEKILALQIGSTGVPRDILNGIYEEDEESEEEKAVSDAEELPPRFAKLAPHQPRAPAPGRQGPDRPADRGYRGSLRPPRLLPVPCAPLWLRSTEDLHAGMPRL